MRHGWLSEIWKYIAAVSLVMAAVCLNLLLTRTVEPSAAPLLFAAVLLASWIGGWGPGLLATALTVVADDYFFIVPLHAWTFDLTVVVRLAVFLTVSLLTSYLTAQQERSLVAERRARLDAEEANRIKDRFLAVTSHELRTPLSAMIMWLEMLDQDHSEDSLREGMPIIRRSAQAIRGMLDELLDSSRITAGKLRLEMRPLDLTEPVRAAVDSIRLLAAERGIDIQVSLPSTAILINADPSRIQQVVSNLLVNAIKFTPRGGSITAAVACTDSHARLTVSDTGRGIAAEDIAHVFKEFWQVPATHASAGDGLGLGLAIARELVRLQGGTIRVESKGKGLGTTFIVDLPIIVDDAKETKPAPMEKESPVLVQG